MPELILTSPTGAMRRMPLSGKELRIGRDASNDVVLDDARLSREHCRISHRAGRYLFEDLHSTHGSLLRGARIHERLLEEGDAIRLGAWTLLFHEKAGAPLPAQPALKSAFETALQEPGAAEIEELSSRLAEIAAGLNRLDELIAHKLKEPLRLMIGGSEKPGSGREPLSRAHAKRLDGVRQSAERALDVVGELRALTRPPNRQGAPPPAGEEAC